MTVVSYLLDVSRINAQSVAAMNIGLHPRRSNSSDEIWKLIHALVKPFAEARSLTGLQKPTLLRRELYLHLKTPEIQIPEKDLPNGYCREMKGATKKRCYMCHAVDAGRVKPREQISYFWRCQLCRESICLLKHGVLFCEECASGLEILNEDESSDDE